ncbi:MAG: IS200/IS605 family element transposase accessory protein TnpB [Candidatus Schekmanbacteria bacterium]|nr:IS200/IS605 family element transposase accessory protein TnpB [Candidatus Schekmanbacteria bacterium]
MSRQESRQVEHALHVVAKQLVAWCLDNDVRWVVIGEPKDIRVSIDYGDRMNQRLHAWPWRKLISFITYKARREGIVLRSEAYTSQRCPACRHLTKANRPSRGVFACRSCGYGGHADLIPCVNHHIDLAQEGGCKVSPEVLRDRRCSGGLALPVVMRFDRHRLVPAEAQMVHEPTQKVLAHA